MGDWVVALSTIISAQSRVVRKGRARCVQNRRKEAKMITRLFEVAIVVRELDAAVEKYSQVLGITPLFMKAEDIPFPGIKVAVFLIGDVVLSLIGSEQADSPVADFLETRGEGLYLIGLGVTDIEQHMREAGERGVRFVMDKPLPYIAGKQNISLPESMHGVQICWAEHRPDWDIARSPRELWGSP